MGASDMSITIIDYYTSFRFFRIDISRVGLDEFILCEFQQNNDFVGFHTPPVSESKKQGTGRKPSCTIFLVVICKTVAKYKTLS